MATSAISGKNGSVNVGGAVSEAKDWEITLDSDALDATTYDSSGWKEFIAGLKGGNGTFATINGTLAVGTHAAATFAVTSGPSIAGAIHVDDIKYGAPVGGIVGYEVTFRFSGEITVS